MAFWDPPSGSKNTQANMDNIRHCPATSTEYWDPHHATEYWDHYHATRILYHIGFQRSSHIKHCPQPTENAQKTRKNTQIKTDNVHHCRSTSTEMAPHNVAFPTLLHWHRVRSVNGNMEHCPPQPRLITHDSTKPSFVITCLKFTCYNVPEIPGSGVDYDEIFKYLEKP